MSRIRDIVGPGLVLMALVMQVAVAAQGSRICVRPQVAEVGHCHGHCHGEDVAVGDELPRTVFAGPSTADMPQPHCCLAVPVPFLVKPAPERTDDCDAGSQAPAPTGPIAAVVHRTPAVRVPRGPAPPGLDPAHRIVRATVLRI